MSWKSSSRDLNGGRLLRDIEEISKALYVHKTPQKALTFQADHGHDSFGDTHVSKSSSNVADDMLRKEKKSSIWSWRPLKGEVMSTRPAQVCQGTAEFEESLMHSSSVYGSRTGHQHSAKYEPKHFLLYVSVIGAPALDIGKHWVDLTRLLPLTVEELEEGRRNSGKWTTSFKLSGKAKGAMLDVSFGFTVSGSNSIEPSPFVRGIKPAIDHFSECDGASANRSLRWVGSVPREPAGMTHSSSRSLDARSFDEVLSDQKSELSRSISFLYKKLEEGKLGKLDDLDFSFEYLAPLKPNSGALSRFSAENTIDDQHIEFSVSELGIESSTKEQVKPEVRSYEGCDDTPIETNDVAYILEERSNEKSEYKQKRESNDVYEGEHTMKSSNYEETDVCKDEMFEELESVFLDLLTAEYAELDSPVDMYDSIDQENYMNLKSSYKSSRRVKSLSLDDVTESVANDFLEMLNVEQTSADLSSDSCLDSPRECLLRPFEKETLSSGNSSFDFDATDDQVEFSGIASSVHGRVASSDDFDLSSVIKDFEKEHKRGTHSLRSKRNAKMIENLETEALMQDWGMNEKAFQNSPRINSGGFGSPIYLSPERPIKLPPLGEGLGSKMCTRNGGFLRSISPQLFRNARNGARLIMQFSSPVVLPAAMGCSVMEILSCWASGGISKMSAQADKMIPLEDITGRNIQEMAWEAGSKLELVERFTFWHGLFGMKKGSEDLLFHQSSGHLNSTSIIDDVDLGFLFKEDLTPLAMNKIESLTIEGLRIQSNLSDNEAPSSIRPQFSEVLGSNTASALKHWCGKESDDDEGALVELSVSLDEWLRLDAGDFSNIPDETKERITKILAAHNVKSVDLDRSGLETGEERPELCNNLTLALRVQLRDPLRDYEMVGISMLILIQLERSCAPVEQNTCSRASERYSSSKNDPKEQFIQEEIIAGEIEGRIHRQAVSQFKITEIHVAGFNNGPNDDRIWGTKSQQQAGSRWLLSSGMGRTSKRPFSKSNAIIRSSSKLRRNMQPGEVLWSISLDFHTRDSKLAASNVHIRNSDIIFPTEGCPNPSQLGIK
ncbi:protein PLASTID MOVEMENT IMPAIRED 1-RELATED 1-like isoform X2 [Solanum dulcamara]|uniref:protein PLASTID MOVEMENT IMPAIRED 1-RELATED 1-like isoform X2 n=1 Tax=Solanum dulcamara TaxID=45834 RepID=UPI002485A05E|nr:protein PLASTID MOVEMENT IMPAIRED 1-RELATED 1-like isoform X2 [Solanum dulcamara]